jgi:uncharacterized membrane protein
MRGAFGPGHMDGFRGNGYAPYGSGHHGFPWLPVAGLAILFVVLVRRGRHHVHARGDGHWDRGIRGQEDSALELLREKFAEGVITQEEFVARRAVLEEDGGEGPGRESK